MRIRFVIYMLTASIFCPGGVGQIHRPASGSGSYINNSSLDTLPFVRMSNSVALRSKIDPSTAEGKRAARYESPDDVPLYDPQTKALNNKSHPATLANPVGGSLPVNIADIIVVGDITSEAAHITKSGARIYTTFVFKPIAYLKELHGTLPIPVFLERGGGVALLPSGEKVLTGTAGFGIPEPHGTYLVFLKYTGIENSYQIVTGFLLDGTKVAALDRRGDSLNGIDSSDLVDKINSALHSTNK
jgi:hypothetical protein